MICTDDLSDSHYIRIFFSFTSQLSRCEPRCFQFNRSLQGTRNPGFKDQAPPALRPRALASPPPKQTPAPLLIGPQNYSASAHLLIRTVSLDARRVRRRGEETDRGQLSACWGRLRGRLSSLGSNEQLTLMSLKVSLRDGQFQWGWSSSTDDASNQECEVNKKKILFKNTIK